MNTGIGTESQKPSYEEWMYWTQVVVDRLREIVRVYSHPPFEDVFIPENEKQFKLAQTVDCLRQLHTLTDDAEDGNGRVAPEVLAERDEHLIAGLQPLFRDILRRLVPLSCDMQKLLKSPWYENCVGQAAIKLFRGPEGRLNEGIGSGSVEHGRLPSVIEDLLEREKMGDDRPVRSEAPPKGAVKLQREELAKRWGRKNSSFLRSAGRMD